MSPEDFTKRTEAFALEMIRLTDELPSRGATAVIGRQLLRSGTSVGANYRAACRAKSRPDFISKLGTVEEECDESIYWMEILVDSGKLEPERVSNLIREANEILSMVVASINTSRTAASQSSIRNPKSPIK